MSLLTSCGSSLCVALIVWDAALHVVRVYAVSSAAHAALPPVLCVPGAVCCCNAGVCKSRAHHCPCVHMRPSIPRCSASDARHSHICVCLSVVKCCCLSRDFAGLLLCCALAMLWRCAHLQLSLSRTCACVISAPRWHKHAALHHVIVLLLLL
jgi:hypothetical protein